MKKIYTLALVFFSSVVSAQWNYVGNAFSNGPIRGLYFLNPDTGFAVGPNGTIAKSTDGGANWVIQTPGADLLRSVYFVDQDTGYVCGKLGQILKSTDQGDSWNVIYSDPNQYFRAVDFPAPAIGLVAGKAGTVLKTIDAGNSWTTHNLGITDADVIQLDMVDASIGYAVCADVDAAHGYIFKTLDGGESWSEVYSNIDTGFLALAVVDADTVYAGGWAQTILKSTDGGANWGELYVGSIQNASYRGAAARTPNSIVMVDDFGYANITFDGGQSWTNDLVDTALFCVQFPNPDLGFTGDEDGNVYFRNFNCVLPGAPGPITGVNSLCSGTEAVYSISPVENADSYSWSVPFDAIIISGQGDTSVVVQFGTTSGDVSVAAVSSGCGTGEATSLAVQIIAVPQPTGITGALSVCSGAEETYSTSSIEGVIDYQWTVPSDATILSGQGDTSIVVQFGTSSGDITVTLSDNLCGAGGTASITVSVNQLPVTGGIAGETTVCEGATLNYSTTSVPYADSYQWTVPPDATINSGQGETSIQVTFGASSGDITVTAVSTPCGSGNTSSISITISPIPSMPAVIFGDTASCSGDTAVYFINSIANADSYTWSVPNNCIILSGQGDTLINVQMGTGVGYVKVAASNSCGTSDQAQLPVDIHPTPTPSITVLAGDTLKSSSPLGNQWYYNGEPIPGATSKIYVPTQNGSYYVVVTSPLGCSAASAPVEVVGVGISGSAFNSSLEIYPNPSSGNTIIQFPLTSDAVITISDIRGRKILEQTQVSGVQFEFDVSRFAKGMYLVKIFNESNKLIGQEKLIVQ